MNDKLKINRLSVGVLRNHPDVVAAIKLAKYQMLMVALTEDLNQEQKENILKFKK